MTYIQDESIICVNDQLFLLLTSKIFFFIYIYIYKWIQFEKLLREWHLIFSMLYVFFFKEIAIIYTLNVYIIKKKS